MENRILQLIRFVSAAVHISGLAALFSGVGTLFLLPVMAWSCLFFLASDNQIRERNSIFLGDLRVSGQVLAASLLFGIILEASNFVTDHHYYVGLPFEVWIRWPFFAAVFAVMVPLILEIERKLENLGLADILTWRKISVSGSLVFGLLLLGMLLLIPLAIIPSVFYPLLFLALLLLLDPAVHLLGEEGKSIIGQFEEAYYGQAFRLISAGILFGFFWEFWNFRAGAKWFYVEPEFEQAFLFEMPILEFWGYAVMALAGYAFFQFCLVMKDRLSQGFGKGTARVLVLIFIVIALAAVLAGMDELTTVSFRQVF